MKVVSLLIAFVGLMVQLILPLVPVEAMVPALHVPLKGFALYMGSIAVAIGVLGYYISCLRPLASRLSR